jgi:hypothetical protein
MGMGNTAICQALNNHTFLLAIEPDHQYQGHKEVGEQDNQAINGRCRPAAPDSISYTPKANADNGRTDQAHTGQRGPYQRQRIAIIGAGAGLHDPQGRHNGGEGQHNRQDICSTAQERNFDNGFHLCGNRH